MYHTHTGRLKRKSCQRYMADKGKKQASRLDSEVCSLDKSGCKHNVKPGTVEIWYFQRLFSESYYYIFLISQLYAAALEKHFPQKWLHS